MKKNLSNLSSTLNVLLVVLYVFSLLNFGDPATRSSLEKWLNLAIPAIAELEKHSKRRNMKTYYLVLTYPDGSCCGPTRLPGVHDQKEAERVKKQQQKLHPTCKVEVTSETAE